MDPFFLKMKRRLQNNPTLFQKSQELNKYLEKDIYTFRTLPHYIWIAGIILLLTSLIATYLIFFDLEYHQRSHISILLNILLYNISFYLFYVGKIEHLIINRKKGFCIYKKTNIFLSKFQINFNFEEINFIEMVMKGNKRGADDIRKYLIRINIKDNRKIEFGHTWEITRIKEKYQICLAMIKGIIIAEVNKNLIKDESIYKDYIY